jgi:hypothetical protein
MQNELCAFTGKSPRDGRPDTARRAGDEDHLASQIRVHVRSKPELTQNAENPVPEIIRVIAEQIFRLPADRHRLPVVKHIRVGATSLQRHTLRCRRIVMQG